MKPVYLKFKNEDGLTFFFRLDNLASTDNQLVEAALDEVFTALHLDATGGYYDILKGRPNSDIIIVANCAGVTPDTVDYTEER